MEKFKVGKTYYCRSICDHTCVWNYTITKRTDKSVWIGGRRFKVGIYDNSEKIFPLGKYSMCPVLRAENEVAELQTELIESRGRITTRDGAEIRIRKIFSEPVE